MGKMIRQARRTCYLTAVLAGMVMSPGCRGGDSGVGSGVTRRDSAGIEIVENPSPTATRPDSVVIGETPMVVIGADTLDPAHELHGPSFAIRLSDGTIVIANTGTNELRFFDAAGKHRRTVGRKGQGPGEYAVISGLARGAADTVIVFDAAQQRATFHAPDGAFVRVVKRVGPQGNPEFAGVMPGALVLRRMRHVGGVDPALAPGGSKIPQSATVFRMSLETGATDSVVTLDLPARHMIVSSGILQDAAGGFSLNHTVLGDGERILVADGLAWETREYSPSGALERIVRRAQTPAPVGTAEVARYRDKTLEGRTGDQRKFWEQLLDMHVYPDRMPAYSGLIVDSARRRWVREFKPSWETGPQRWTVVSPDGVIVAEAAVPADLEIREIGADHLIARRQVAFGVEQIVVLPVRTPSNVRE
jgi:hypothetical protein